MADLAGSADISPLQFWGDWQVIVIAGTTSPGVIAQGGITGFDRTTEWDVKKGKGTQGATLTLTSLPPAEGSITFVLWLSRHFTEWRAFRQLLKYNGKKTKTQSSAFDIYHPSLADLNITSCVTKKVSPINYKGNGRYEVTVEFIEWLPVPPKPIVVTPSGSAAGKSGTKNPGDTGDPVADQQQQIIAQLMVQATNTPTG